MVLLTPLASRFTSTNRPSRAMSLTMASPGAMRSGRSPRTGVMVSGPVQRISRGWSAGLVVGFVVDGFVVAAANWRVVGRVVTAACAGPAVRDTSGDTGPGGGEVLARR